MLNNVIRIELKIQKNSPRYLNMRHPERRPASYCSCQKFNFKRTCSADQIQRGEVVYELTRQTNVHTDKETGIKTPWKKSERWRPECLTNYMLQLSQVYLQKNILPPLKKDLRRTEIGRPSLLKDVWRLTDTQVENRRLLQRRLSMYKHRLSRYLENLEPTDRTIKAIANCRVKIEIAETALKAQLTSAPIMEPGFQDEGVPDG